MFTYGWSLLLTENWLGLLYFQLNFGLVIFAHGGKLVGSFLTSGSLGPEFGLLYVSRTVSKKSRPASKKTSIVSKRDAFSLIHVFVSVSHISIV